MGIENLNRFHWLILGALLGAALGWSWASNSDAVEGVESTDVASFERDVMQSDPVSKKPLVTDVVIHPPEYSETDQANVNLVTFKRLARTRSGQYGWIDKRVVALIPYTPQLRGRVAATPDMTIQTYLAELAKNNTSVNYKYGWWLVPQKAAGIGAGAGAILIGGIWPTLLGLMSGAGLGPRRKSKGKKERSLWSYKSTTREVKAKAGPTAADQAEVQAIADAYERSLGQDATEGTSPAAAEQAAPAEVRKLQAETLEDGSKAQPSDDEVEVKNREFYPVLIHHDKKKDEDKKPAP